ncbi:MAG: helix-turn-helix transcriptional regulator [Candidatus Desulfofervidus auxilii]|nr:helix-turn-helix transcriptional regulator [Candidatus Desulfofervidus auxilii]
MKKIKKIKSFLKEIKKTDSYIAEQTKLDFVIQIYKLMKEFNITQKELARKLNVSEAYVSKILRGDINFTIETMVKLTRALNSNLHIKVVPAYQDVRWFSVIKNKEIQKTKEKSYFIPKLESNNVIEETNGPIAA